MPRQHPLQGALLAALFFAALFTLGCGETFKLPVKSMPAGASYDGLWYSNYGDMNLVQNGTKVQGTFEYKTGGTLAGELQGGVLVFDWVQVGDLNVGRREVKGKGYLVMGDGGKTLLGRWGYGDDLINGGEWSADKAVENYSE